MSENKEFILILRRNEIKHLLDLVIENTVVSSDPINDDFVNAVIEDIGKQYTSDGKTLKIEFAIYLSGILRNYVNVWLKYKDPNEITKDGFLRLFHKKENTDKT